MSWLVTRKLMGFEFYNLYFDFQGEVYHEFAYQCKRLIAGIFRTKI